MIRTEQIRVKRGKALANQCHLAKNLYNEANYIVRQEFIKTSKEKELGLREKAKWIRYYDLNTKLKSSENYKSLPIQTSQQILRLLDKNWKSFFKSIKEYKGQPDKFLGQPSLPRYKDKNGQSILIFTNQNCKIKNGYIKFPKKTCLRSIKTRFGDTVKLREVRIIPKANSYMAEIVYDKKVNPRILDKNKIISVDIGLRNFVTIANNFGQKPIVIKGGVLKSINQYYNKKLAGLKSIYDKQGIKKGKKVAILTEKRNAKVKDQLHKVSRFLIDYALRNNVGKIVIGYNPDWKQKISLGKRNNQNFVQLPFLKEIQQVQYKGEEVGIEVELPNEAHTSKCSFLDNEPIEHHGAYVGKRISRGLFRTANGTVLNADVNASLNILRKCNPEAMDVNILGRDRGAGLVPLRLVQPYKQSLLKMENNV